MFLKKLLLQNFRNYTEASIEFNTQGNLLFGKNGQGKTNLLESIYFLSVFRSFRRGTGRDIVTWDESWFKVSGFFDTAQSLERTISVQWERDGSKQVFYENDRVPAFSDMIGVFPTVVLSPESVEISQGLPVERRRFLDLCFSMVDSEYLAQLMDYKRVLKQRNSLLVSSYEGGGYNERLMEPWNEKIIQLGSYLTDYRSQAVESLARICCEMYGMISGGGEELIVRYRPSISDCSDTAERFRQELFESRENERRKNTTLVGPHRDDLLMFINGHDARKFGSQGQHKTIMLALKAAEVQFISGKKDVQPVILLDDLFALLDNKRIMAFLSLLARYSQFFITANVEIDSEALLARAGFKEQEFSQYLIEGGTIQRRL